MKLKQSYVGLLLLGLVPMCFAGIPATTQYVDTQVAGVQSQIDAINSNPAIAHPVGSCYGGGVVYYVNPDANAAAGQRGLIVSLTDAGTPSTYAWGPNPTDPVINTSAKYFTGLQNTVNIEARSTADFPAANAANSYTSTATCDTCTPWYLPAQDELATLYFQSTNVTNFGTACAGYSAPSNVNAYWSSTQSDANNAWGVGFGSGSVGFGFLNGTFRVRPVRAF